MNFGHPPAAGAVTTKTTSVVFNQTFNEKVDPLQLARAIMWEIP
ncbi:MAG: hypothetical protein ACRD0S_11405 [Acidimicrobiales bacterium]